MLTQRHVLALAFARGADIEVMDIDLTPSEADQLGHLCAWLSKQGDLAAFTLSTTPARITQTGALGAIRQRLGSLTVDACLASGPRPNAPSPAFLMPVWAFDHLLGDLPASTANFLGLDLEVVAPPSEDPEVGAAIPGLPGLRLLHIRPVA